MPGSIVGKLNIPSINNFVDLCSSMIPQYMIQGSVYPINFVKSGWFYSINFESILVETLTINKRSIKFLPNSNTIRFDFSEINLKAIINSDIKVFWIFPIKLQELNLKGISFELELAPEALDSITEWFFRHD